MSTLFELCNEHLILDAHKVIFWPKYRILVVSDVHLGKAGHFRKHGMAVPQNVHVGDLNRLSNLIFEYDPLEIYFLGDLFHSDLNAEWNLFEEWMSDFSMITFTLILGNHDILDHKVYGNSALLIESEIVKGPFSFTHERTDSSFFNISGHIHPGVRLQGAARQGITLPCFYFGKRHAIMPAFGDFTGIAKIRPQKGDAIFAVAEDQIIELVG